MAPNKNLVTKAIPFTFVLAFFSLAVASRGHAQTPPTGGAYLFRTSGENSNPAPFPGPSSVAYFSASVPPQAHTTSPNDKWSFAVSPYLWFPGVRGTAVGPNGRGISFRASPGDLLSHFRFGLMGAVEANRKRLVITGDLLWVRLKDDKAIPFPGIVATSATVKATEFFLAPKVGLRLINQEKIKIDALTGLRYWHLGETLNFNPSLLGLNSSSSQDFVDPLVGGRIETFLSPKVVINAFGDVGGWGTGSQLEYQCAGLLGYRINARWTLHAGYRYLNVDKHDGAVFKATTAGVMSGITLNLK